MCAWYATGAVCPGLQSAGPVAAESVTVQLHLQQEHSARPAAQGEAACIIAVKMLMSSATEACCSLHKLLLKVPEGGYAHGKHSCFCTISVLLSAWITDLCWISLANVCKAMSCSAEYVSQNYRIKGWPDHAAHLAASSKPDKGGEPDVGSLEQTADGAAASLPERAEAGRSKYKFKYKYKYQYKYKHKYGK